MKRTKNINRDAFRKTWRQYRLAPVAAAVGAVLMLTACDEADETVALYTTAEQCSAANPSQAGECTTAYNNAKAAWRNSVKLSVLRHQQSWRITASSSNLPRHPAASGCR